MWRRSGQGSVAPYRGRVDDVELSVRHRRADQVMGLCQLVLVIHHPVLLDDVGGLDAPGVAASRKGTRGIGWGGMASRTLPILSYFSRARALSLSSAIMLYIKPRVKPIIRMNKHDARAYPVLRSARLSGCLQQIGRCVDHMTGVVKWYSDRIRFPMLHVSVLTRDAEAVFIPKRADELHEPVQGVVGGAHVLQTVRVHEGQHVGAYLPLDVA